ncbi:hypothetical protein O181_071791 [Austropuccinia psidii MF-1]|uniref:Reverse transcriptase Ty1/copia-type domain-containing protein n=1 Tax=Austropuccinia psidii MF-1 TaxID=1389203 RepID=A0A9Q3I6U6_9BASI|nr:hypothetical protein [Austropuccinia psidii MF-1]
MIRELDKQDKFVATMNASTDQTTMIPCNFKDVAASNKQEMWMKAINEEIKSMEDQEVFEVIDLNHALKNQRPLDILSTRWVFAKKTSPMCYKARLVAWGFQQTKGVNFKDTFGALRLLLSIAVKRRWEIKTFDVKVAFLHSMIDMPVFIWPPQGMDVERGKVLKLKKALYGTKQAARCWWQHLSKILENIGFHPNKEDLSTYSYASDEGTALLWIHVDDGVLTSSSSSLLKMISNKLNLALNIKWDEKISGLVGLTIETKKAGLYISQLDLIRKLTSLSPSNITAKSPLPTNCTLVSGQSKSLDIPYLKQIGILLYIAQGSRPDITFADIGKDVECYVNANWGGEGNRSSHGFLILHNGNPIAWQSKRQAVVASSTCQAEYIALSFASKECLWLTNLFQPILDSSRPILYSDNKTSVNIALNIANRKQTCHLIREFNVINEYILRGKVTLTWVSTQDQMADIMTKALGSNKVKTFLTNLSRGNYFNRSCGGECYDSTKNQKEHSRTTTDILPET